MWQFLFTHTPLLYLTQSVWRDEAFSLLLAEQSPLYFIPRLTFEPPFYYILLHFWVQLFGNGEILARSLSLIGFILANVVVIFWGERLFKKHWLSWFLPLFFFFNPQLLYYAFEIRAYGWYMFFAVASMYAYMEKRWVLYVLSTTLGIYTHTYMVIVPAMQVLHFILMHKHMLLSAIRLKKDSFVRSLGIIALLVSPWIAKIFIDIPRLKQSWYFPVDMQLVKSAVANIFLGYEGTPPDFWDTTAFLSVLLIGISAAALRAQDNKNRNGFFFLLAFVPLVTILAISVVKPLFVNRYLLPATIAQVFLVVFALETIRNATFQKIAAALLLFGVIGFNIWYPSRHAKKDIRTTIQQINAIASSEDVILTDSPLILFETIYYSNSPSRVFWYNPENTPFPWYIGDIVFSPTHMMRNDLPPYPTRAFLINSDMTFTLTYNISVSTHQSERKK
jgi:mannosyltransferase